MKYPPGWPQAPLNVRQRLFYAYSFTTFLAGFFCVIGALGQLAVILVTQWGVMAVIYSAMRRTAWDEFMEDESKGEQQ